MRTISSKQNHQRLEKFRLEIPFLLEIPDDIYFNLDSSEFYFPTEKISAARRSLEFAFNQYVMTYKRDVFQKEIPWEHHLCRRIAEAKLNRNEVRILLSTEKKFEHFGVSFVIYKKPLQLIAFEEGPVTHITEGMPVSK